MHQAQPHVTLIGVPTDVGASRLGAAMGPDALRVAQLGPALAQLGVQVHDTVPEALWIGLDLGPQLLEGAVEGHFAARDRPRQRIEKQADVTRFWPPLAGDERPRLWSAQVSLYGVPLSSHFAFSARDPLPGGG